MLYIYSVEDLTRENQKQTVKWTTDHPPLPSNREKKTLAGVILQQEVLVRNKELTSYHQPEFWRGQKEMGDSSSEVLPTSQDPPHWNPPQLNDACAPRKDPNSEWLARDKPETKPMTIKSETVSHVAEQFSPFPSPSCPPPQHPFPIKPLAWTALLSSDNAFPSIRQEPTLKPWKGSPFLRQKQYPGENILKTLSCREGNRRRQWQPTPVLLPGESHGQRSLKGCNPGVAKSWTRLHWATSLFTHWRRTWQPTPMFLPGESQGQRSLVGRRVWGHTVRHGWSDLEAEKEMPPPPVFWPQKSQGQRSLVGYSPTAGHFSGEETVPGKLRHSPKAREFFIAQPELWLRIPSCQASWSWPLSLDTCVEN